MTASISDAGLPSSFIASTHTSSASVESSPPEIPITSVFALVWRTRFSSPCACIVRISSQRLSVSAEVFGTNGVRRTILVSSAGFISISNGIRRIPGRRPPTKLVLRRRSEASFWTSISVTVSPVEYSLLSARTIPFSAIISCPPNTRSCVLSPEPALAYTYPHSRRADWLLTSSRR